MVTDDMFENFTVFDLYTHTVLYFDYVSLIL